MKDIAISMRVAAEPKATPASMLSWRARDGATCIGISVTHRLYDLLHAFFNAHTLLRTWYSLVMSSNTM